MCRNDINIDGEMDRLHEERNYLWQNTVSFTCALASIDITLKKANHETTIV